MSDRRTVLITVTGHDGPGISAGLFETLSGVGAKVLDIEQISVRQRLTLSVLIDIPDNDNALKDMLLFGYQNDMHVDVQDITTESVDKPFPHVVTLIGRDLTPAELATATTALASAGANIERIVRLSKYPVMSYELTTSGGRTDDLKVRMMEAAAKHPRMDVAVQQLDLSRRAKRLVVMDVDSTLIQDEVIVLLAEQAGTAAEVHNITEAAMAGELDFEESLRARVKLLAGLDEAAVERAWGNLTLTPGSRTFMRTLKRLGYTTAIVSGGFTVFTDRLRDELDIDFAHANVLESVDGVLTGGLDGPIVDRAAKATFLRDVSTYSQVPLEQCVAVGDGANDLDMLAVAGLGIAFNAKQVVREAADTSIGVPYLDAVLFLLGVRREEIEAADRDDI